MKKIAIISALALTSFQMNAQMADLSIIIEPIGSYNWFDKNTHIDNGLMYGGRVGFGFGEAIELRFIYERSADLKNTVRNLNFANQEFIDNFTSRDVEIERIGGEFKANIPSRGTFVPYITFGAGVQKLKVDVSEEGFPEVIRTSEQLYGNIGLGTQIKLAERVFLSFEAKNTIFNMDPADVLYRQGPNSGVGDWLNDKSDRMYNWSGMAGLKFYLGGHQPGSMSDLDRAYYNKFTGGMSGLKLILELGGSYINFNNNSNLNNTYLLGGKAGFDLNQFIGLRGYYYQSTKDERISANWDDLAIYGGDIVAKLNVARGIIPYIELGGGYLNIYDGYKGKNPFLSVQEPGYFAKGGIGLSVPVFKNFEIFGSASVMYTSHRADNDIQNIINPSELSRHTMYNSGIKFKIGKSANTQDPLDNLIDARVKERTDVYEDRIKQLEKELQKAYNENDTKKAVEIIEEKKAIEEKKKIIVDEENGVYKKTGTSEKESGESKIRMTPAELEKLIEKVIQGVDEDANKPNSTEDRIDRLERLLLEINTGGRNSGVITPVQQDLASDKIIRKLDELNTKIDNNASDINRISSTNQAQDKTVIVTPGASPQPQMVAPSNIIVPQNLNNESAVVVTDGDNAIVSPTKSVATGYFLNEGISLFTGFAFGDGTAGILGIRGHYAISNSPIKFMPDLYINPGKNTGFGININALLAFKGISNIVILEPYIGLGLGYNKAGNYNNFGTNVIVGTSFNVLGGRIYTDFTIRNLFKMNQISVGYKFGF